MKNRNSDEAHHDDPTPVAEESAVADQTPAGTNAITDVVATEAGSAIPLGDASEPVRVGSPFAEDPALGHARRPVEPLYDVGTVRYMAMGAVVAAIMDLGFGVAAAWWFPVGGTMIAALGCVLSILGLYSVFRNTAAILLVLHLGLFVFCYSQAVG